MSVFERLENDIVASRDAKCNSFDVHSFVEVDMTEDGIHQWMIENAYRSNTLLSCLCVWYLICLRRNALIIRLSECPRNRITCWSFLAGWELVTTFDIHSRNKLFVVWSIWTEFHCVWFSLNSFIGLNKNLR